VAHKSFKLTFIFASVFLLFLCFSSPSFAIVAVELQTAKLSATADATILEINPSSNFGPADPLQLGTYVSPTGNKRYRVLIKFDLTSQVPRGSTIQSANLYLYNTYIQGPQLNDLKVYRVAPRLDWSESTVKWDNRPDWIDPGYAFGTSSNGWFRSGVTDIVRLWSAGTEPNYGFYILAPLLPSGTATGTFAQMTFASRDNFTNSHRPYLDVVYTPPAPLTVPNITNNQLDLSNDVITKKVLPGSGSDQTPPQISGVRVSVTQNTAEIVWTTDEPSTSQVFYGTSGFFNKNSPTDSELVTNHKVSLTGLLPSQAYSFEVFSEDASGNSEHSMADVFTTLEATSSTGGQSDGQSKQSSNPLEQANKTLTQKLSDAVVEAEINKEGTKSSTQNPVIVLSQKLGVNKVVGIIFIVTALVALITAIVIFKLSHKTYHHVKKHLGKKTEPKPEAKVETEEEPETKEES